jgi:hypothetical protein
VKELGPGEPVRSLAHSRACVFGRATFLALLGLATRPRPRRTEGVSGLGSRCGPSDGHPSHFEDRLVVQEDAAESWVLGLQPNPRALLR